MDRVFLLHVALIVVFALMFVVAWKLFSVPFEFAFLDAYILFMLILITGCLLRRREELKELRRERKMLKSGEIVIEKERHDDYVEYNVYDGFFLLVSIRKYRNGKRVVDVMKENVPEVNVILDGGVKKFE